MSRPVDPSDLDRLGAGLRQEMASMGGELRQEMVAMGGELRQEMAAMGGELRQEMAASAAGLREEIRGTGEQIRTELREEIHFSFQQVVVQLRQEIQSSAADTRRHFDVVAEDLKSDVKAVAEGLGALDERVERFRSEVRGDFSRVDRRLLHLEVRVIGRSDPS